MELEFLKRIVKEAEKISAKNFEVHQKGDKGDLVTNLDLEIEQYLIGQMNAEYPDYAVVSEEFNSDKVAEGNCFTIDPIDGTINFANGLPVWGIQVACKKDGKTVACVIDLPALHEFYCADEAGAYCNGERIAVKEVSLKNTIYSIVGHSVTACEMKMRYYSRNRRNFGAVCAAFAFLASGRIHGVNFRVDQPWDYEPGLYLCEKAGAVTKSKNGFHAAAMNQEFLDLLEKETAL